MRDGPKLEIVVTAGRPELVPIVAAWLWEEFRRRRGHSFEETLASVEASVKAARMPRTFVILAHGEPVGMASLAEQDLEERPDLTPWLAGVYVTPGARGRGFAARLIGAVEEEARTLSFSRIWLYTRSAEKVYARAGWTTVEWVAHDGKPYALMRRDLV